jgi:Protein of unknown function (DUF1579)
MIDNDQDQAILRRLVGCWAGTVLHRASADQPFAHMPGTSENRWVLGGRFVEMTLRAGESWSAVVYIGYERSERRHVLVSLEPGDRRVITRRGEWVRDSNRLLLTSDRSKATCEIAAAGELKLEFVEQGASGLDFVRLKAEYRPAIVAGIVGPPVRQPRRFVIA